MHHQPETFPQWTDVFGLSRMAVCRRIQKGCQNTFPRDGFRENAVILMAAGKPAAVIRLILACRAVLNRIDLVRKRQYFASQQSGMPETAQQVGVGENRLARQKRLYFLVIFGFGNLPFFQGPIQKKVVHPAGLYGEQADKIADQIRFARIFGTVPQIGQIAFRDNLIALRNDIDHGNTSEPDYVANSEAGKILEDEGALRLLEGIFGENLHWGARSRLYTKGRAIKKIRELSGLRDRAMRLAVAPEQSEQEEPDEQEMSYTDEGFDFSFGELLPPSPEEQIAADEAQAEAQDVDLKETEDAMFEAAGEQNPYDEAVEGTARQERVLTPRRALRRRLNKDRRQLTQENLRTPQSRFLSRREPSLLRQKSRRRRLLSARRKQYSLLLNKNLL